MSAHFRADASLHRVSWRAQGILEEALKGAVILAILERLCLTRNTNWLEARLGAAAFICMRAAAAAARGTTLTMQR
jgi:hypothetical protein